MKIYIDSKETRNHPEIKDILESLGVEYDIVTLSVGDFLYNNIIIEHKSYTDYVLSIKNGLLFKQIYDMGFNKNFFSYILVSCRLKDILILKDGMTENELFGSIASVFIRGTPIFFCENIEHMIKIMIKLFEKHTDEKLRIVNPQRNQVTISDKVSNHYATIPTIGYETAKNLTEKFPVPSGLYNATVKELQEVPLVGKKRAKDIYNFLHGNQKKEDL